MTFQASPDSLTSSDSTVPVIDESLISRLRTDLHNAGWYIAQINGLLSEAALGALMRDQRVPALVELTRVGAEDEGWARAVLTRFFMLGSRESSADIEVALPTLGVGGLMALGLANSREDGLLEAAFDLRPHEASLPTASSFIEGGNPDERQDWHWWVLSDLGEATTGQPLQRDHVLGIGGATMNLLALTMRRPVHTALDLGTGCGIQALYLATHAQKVVATDISVRAVEITRFNAVVNQANIDARVGSLFEPVAGEKFDLIVSNPPFVITPQSLRAGGLMEYRDGGMERDTLIGTIIRQAPEYLSDSGVMQMLGNWEIALGQDLELGWQARVEYWLEGLPVDAWVLQRDVLDPAQYVEMWLRDSGGTLQERATVEHAYTEWISDFTQAGVGHIGMGSLALRRTQGIPKRHFDYLPGGNAPTGADVLTVLENLDAENNMLCAQDSEANIWNHALVRREDVTEERHYTPGASDPSVLIVRQGGGMGRSFRVGSNTSAFIGACDGELTVGQIADAIAVITEQDSQAVREEIASLLPDLLRCGMLTRRKTHAE